MNVPPSSGTEPRRIKQLNRAATEWLRRNDKQAKIEEFKEKKRREKAGRQARENPALVASYRKAMFKAR